MLSSLREVPQCLIDYVTGRVDTSGEIIDVTDLQSMFVHIIMLYISPHICRVTELIVRGLAARPSGCTLDDIHEFVKPVRCYIQKR